MGEYVKTAWNILDIFFKDNPNFLVNHHLQSYNDFFDNGITQILKEKEELWVKKLVVVQPNMVNPVLQLVVLNLKWILE